MKPVAPLAAALVLTFFAAAASGAAEYGAKPGDYESAASAYIESRLENAQGAVIRTMSEPYPVLVSLRGRDLACWAVDMRIKADLPGGGFDRFAPVTVLFYDGRPFATKDDVSRFTRIDDGVKVAGN